MRKPHYWNKAKTILSKKDKVMKKLINSYKDGFLVTRNDVFFSLWFYSTTCKGTLTGACIDMTSVATICSLQSTSNSK